MMENQERLVSSVSFSIWRSRVTRYSPMPPMQTSSAPSLANAMPSGRPPTCANTSCRS